MNNLPCRVLLVEDNEDDYLIVRDLLTDIATTVYDLEWVDTCEAAREALTRHEYDVCLVDYRLGEATGVELAREFSAGHTPFVLLTGNEDYEVDVAAAKAGVADYLVKGRINAALMERAIRYSVERKKSEVALLHAQRFAQATVDALPDHMAVLDSQGTIVAVNATWREFAAANGFADAAYGLGSNYLEVCEKSNTVEGRDSSAGIRAVITGAEETFRFTYTCHSPHEQRWFEMVVTRFSGEGPPHVVVAHENITRRKLDEQRLLASEANLVKAQRMAHLGSWELDLTNLEDINSNSLRWSDELFCILGYDPGEIEVSNDIFFDAVHPDDRETLSRTMRESLQSGKPYSVEHRIILPDGRERIVQSQGEISYSEETGQPVKVIGLGQDVTESRLAQRALQESEQEQRYLAERVEIERARLAVAQRVAKMGSWETDLATMTVIWSEETHRIFETDPVTFHPTHRDFLELAHPEDRASIADAFARSLDQLATSELEHRVVVPDGRIKFVEERWQVSFDGQGKPVRAIGTCRDITERKLAENALRDSEAEFRMLAEAMPQMVWITRPDGWHIHFNQQWMDYTGLSLEESLGFGWNPPFHPDDRHRAAKIWQQATQSGEPYEIEYRLRRADGVYRWMLGRALPMRDATGTIVKWFGTCTDIHDLKKAEEERDRFFMLSLDMMAVIGSDGYFKRLNPAFEPTLGFSNAELMAVPFLEFVHPEDIASTLEGMGKLVNGIQVVHENRYRCRDGSYKWLEWMAAPFEDLWYCVAHDVTGARQAEAALRVSEERFRQMAESVDEVFWLFDPSQEKLLYISPAFEKLWGFSGQSLLDQSISFMDTVHPDDRERIVAALEHQGKPNGYSEEHRIVRPDGSVRWVLASTYPIYNKQGEVYRIAGVAQDIDARKKAEAALRQANEGLELRVEERTSELQQANNETRIRALQQEAVAELGHRALTDIDMDTLLETATDLVTITLNVEISCVLEAHPTNECLRVRASTGLNGSDISTRVIPGSALSHAGYALLSDTPTIVTDLRSETRFKPSELLLGHEIVSGMTVIVRGHERPYGTIGAHTVKRRQFTQDDVNFLQSMANILAAALEQRRIGAEIRQLNMQLGNTNEQLKIENDERQRALGALREASRSLELAKVEAERARENADAANLAKSEFLSRMSHELRTPLNGILGFGQILEMGNRLNDKDSQAVTHILKSGRHLLGLIDEVLDIARIEAGRMSLSPEPVFVGQTVRDVVDMVRPLSTLRGIRIINDVAEHDERHVRTDLQRFRQILLNLLSNAIKYNREAGQVTLSCTDRGAALRLNVRDTGFGLNTEDIGKLFMPFERLGAAESQIEGTGIGLALCKKLTEAMDGEIGVESTPGQGSTFWVEFPLVDGLTMQPQPSGELSNSHCNVGVGHSQAAQRTILYIEDNLLNYQLIASVLADRSDLSLLSAMQGGIGLDLARQHIPDVILLDLHLPDIPGDVVLKQLRGNALTRDIPVIMLSADAMPGQVAKLRASGISDYLTKPINVRQFLHVLQEALDEGDK
jgi:PAS domain S-box-containing protein